MVVGFEDGADAVKALEGGRAESAERFVSGLAAATTFAESVIATLSVDFAVSGVEVEKVRSGCVAVRASEPRFRERVLTVVATADTGIGTALIGSWRERAGGVHVPDLAVGIEVGGEEKVPEIAVTMGSIAYGGDGLQSAEESSALFPDELFVATLIVSRNLRCYFMCCTRTKGKEA